MLIDFSVFVFPRLLKRWGGGGGAYSFFQI